MIDEKELVGGTPDYDEIKQEFPENVVNTEPTPLDPSPAVVHGEAEFKEVTEKLGESYGSLSPNPNYQDSNVKGSDVPENMHPQPANDKRFGGEKPEYIKNLMARLIDVKELLINGKPIADFIDSEGGVTESEMETYVGNADIKTIQLEDSSTNSGKVLKVNASGGVEAAGVGSLDFTDVDFKAKTLSQTQPNWEIDVKSLLSPNFFKDTSNLYAKMCLMGNELSLVISGKFVAKADANAYHPIFTNQVVNIPDSIASKIFRADGTSFDQNASTAQSSFDSYIAANYCLRGKGSAIQSCYFNITSLVAKTISSFIYGFGATEEDDSCYIDLRIQFLIV